MTRIVGVRFQQAGKIYYFDPSDYELEMAMHVIVETARGVEMGTVLIPPKDVEDDQVIQPLKPVIRVATDEDEKTMERNKERAKEAFAICKEKILKHELELKLVSAEYTFDNNKLLFYFTADGRIDFRDLVKDLAAVFRTRIELRQIGVRDETKMMGGVGICGRELCCRAYLSDFVPVSIKMAKEQNLSLNPTKISGVCGRLMCCLKNEQETYEYLNSRLPSVGDTVTTPEGWKGEVSSVSVLRQNVKVIIDNGEEKELRDYPVDKLTFRARRKDVKLTEEELKELEGLEDPGVAEGKSQKPERNDGQNRPDKQDQGNKNNREDKFERYNKSDRYERGNRSERTDKYDKNDRNERTEKSDHYDKNNRYDKKDRYQRHNRGENSSYDKNSHHSKYKHDGKGKRNFDKKGYRRDRADYDEEV